MGGDVACAEIARSSNTELNIRTSIRYDHMIARSSHWILRIHRHAWNTGCTSMQPQAFEMRWEICSSRQPHGWLAVRATATTSRTARKPASYPLFGSPSAFSLDEPDFRPGNTVGHRILYHPYSIYVRKGNVEKSQCYYIMIWLQRRSAFSIGPCATL